MEDFKKVKKYSIGDDGDNLLSQWTSDQTVEMSSGETLQEKANSIDKDISDEITRAKKAESDLDNKKIDKTMVATNETLGLVKSGTDITVDDDGNVSVNDNSHKHLLSNISDLAITAEELNVLDGITASTDELNKLHNTTAITEDFNKLHEITASAEELNILDGITISTEELNNISGINGNIQEQLNSKASLDSPVLTGVPQAPTATADTNTSQIATTEFAHTAISNHNVSTTSHNDIRDLITGLTNRLNALADSDDETLDQMSEIVTYIKANKSLIDSVTTTKINVSDIVDDLITNVTDKPLSASQGVIIKELIDTLQTEVNTKAKQSDLTKHTDDTVIHITAEERTNWTKAYTNTHSHSNKDVLDGITTELIEKWNKGSEDSGSGVVTGVTGIKGGAETDYRTGDVNITLENLMPMQKNGGWYEEDIDDLRYGKMGVYWTHSEKATGTQPFSGYYALEVMGSNEHVIIQVAYGLNWIGGYLAPKIKYRIWTNNKWYDWGWSAPEATTTESGLMSASDKKKLDSLEPDGSSGGGHIVSTTQPENTNLLWIDTSVSPAVMKYHNGESWISITTTAVWG